MTAAQWSPNGGSLGQSDLTQPGAPVKVSGCCAIAKAKIIPLNMLSTTKSAPIMAS